MAVTRLGHEKIAPSHTSKHSDRQISASNALTSSEGSLLGRHHSELICGASYVMEAATRTYRVRDRGEARTTISEHILDGSAEFIQISSTLAEVKTSSHEHSPCFGIQGVGSVLHIIQEAHHQM